MERIKIRFEQSTFNGICRDMEEYTRQIKEFLDKYLTNEVIRREDVTLPLVRGIFNRNATLLLDAISKNGNTNTENINFALRDAMVQKVREVREMAASELRMMWNKRENCLTRYRAVSDTTKSAFVTMDPDGGIIVDVEAIREFCTVYMEANKKTVELLERVKKIFQDLRDLDKDLLRASTSLPVYVIGDLSDNALIKVENAHNIWLDLPMLEDLDGSINRVSYANDRDKYWHVQDFIK